MNEDELIALAVELDGKVDLGMSEDALAICKRILDEAEEIESEIFVSVCLAVGTFVDDMTVWLKPLSLKFEALGDDDKPYANPVWVYFMCAAGVEWEVIKPLVTLRELPNELMVQTCIYAMDAGDTKWCREALKSLDPIGSHFTANYAHRLARAALQCGTQDYLAALDTLHEFKINELLFEDYCELLTRATAGHYLQSLEKFTVDIQQAERRLDVDTELTLPGNDMKRYTELKKAVTRAILVTKRLNRVLKTSVF